MLASSIPAKIAVPFGNSAGGSYIRTVPVASQIGINAGYASYTDGFVPLNMTPVGAGGVPPFGQDMNGILNAITKWNQWQNAGGPIPYDSSFSSTVGGYPRGAIVDSATTFGVQWLCTADNNTTNPDSSGSNWIQLGTPTLYAVDSGSVNAYAATFPTPLVAHTPGLLLAIKISHTNNASSTLNPGPGTKNIYFMTNGGPNILFPAMLTAGMIAYFVYDGTQYELINPVISPTGSTNAFVSGTGSFTNNHFGNWDSSGNLKDSGYVANGNQFKVATVIGTLVVNNLVAADGNGNIADSGRTVTGTGTSVLTIIGAITNPNRFISVDAFQNGQDSGFGPGSFASAASIVWTWSSGATLATGVTTFSHSLGLDFKAEVQCVIVCNSADAGYAVGDSIPLASCAPANASNNETTIFKDSSGNSVSLVVNVGVSAVTKSGSGIANLTLSKWTVFFGVKANH